VLLFYLSRLGLDSYSYNLILHSQKEKMGAGKSKLDGVSMEICFEGDSRAFDAQHPIVGTIHIQSNQAIPAYGI